MLNKWKCYYLYQRSGLSHCCNAWRIPTGVLLSKRNMLSLPPASLGNAVFIPATFQMTPCFTVPVSWASTWLELVCHSVRGRSCLLPFSPLLLLAGARWQATQRQGEKRMLQRWPVAPISSWTIYVWEKYLPLVTCSFPLWVMSLPFFHHSPPLPFPIMAKQLLQLCSQAEWPDTSKCRQIGVCPIFG